MDKLNIEKDIEKCPAKSGGKTIGEHNKDLEGLSGPFEKIVRECSSGTPLEGVLDEVFRLLPYAIKNHDYGKANKEFAAMLKDPRRNKQSIYHHLLSPLYFLYMNADLPGTEKSTIIKAILNHHHRQSDMVKPGLRDYGNVRGKLNKMEKELLITIDGYPGLLEEYMDILVDIKMVVRGSHCGNGDKIAALLTGFLIRLDHAASGEIEVEEEPVPADRLKLFQGAVAPEPREFQKCFKDKQDLCIVADTGLGKTGLSVLWSRRKQFYILPNRSSTNAMYETLKKVYGDHSVGLLHSTALYYCLDGYGEGKEPDAAVLKDYRLTKALAKPVTLCTADQLFTAVFKYPTYEKIYATLAYSDVIIDEIQGFSPQQILPMIRQIRETKELGARYLLTTATLPDIVAEELKGVGIEVVENDPATIDSVKRHRLRVCPGKTIYDICGEALGCMGSGKKVLIVVNTVKTAQKVYGDLNKGNGKVNILHSRYIWKERWEKETDIILSCKQDMGDPERKYMDPEGCVWVCTQLVEASLDIDFDILYTEAAPIDSLVQRMGRVWRHRLQNYTGEANIIITGISGDDEKRVNFVYDRSQRDEAMRHIEEVVSSEQGYFLSSDKRKLVKELYSRDRLERMDSSYLKEWEEVNNAIDAGWDVFNNSKEGAGRLFRDTFTVEMIPGKYKEEVTRHYEGLKDLKKLKPRERSVRRADILKEIQKYRVPVPVYYISRMLRKNGHGLPYEILDRAYNIVFLNKALKYDEKLGLTGEIEEPDFNARWL